jgi:UDP-N-acetylglucosamine 2-epimerase (non-hydrolysing)
MAPVIQALRRHSWARVSVISTGQHRDMISQMLDIFSITPDHELDVMRPGQSLAELTARLLQGLDPLLAAAPPACVLAQGDTTTVLASAMTCFYRNIPFGHVEAGLRTHQLNQPFPEEFNRVVGARIAAIHFAPSESARANLLREGVPALPVWVGEGAAREAPWLSWPSRWRKRLRFREEPFFREVC